MPTYITMYNLTGQGVKDIKNAPKRVDEAIKAFETMGGKLIGFYLVMGEYDYVAIGEFPNDEAAATFQLGLAAQGNVKTTTLKAFTREEFAKIVKALP